MTGHDSDETVCARALGGEEPFDERAAYARFRASAVRRANRSPIYFAAGLAAAIVLAIVFAAPIGSAAQGFLTIFQPKQFAAIDVSSLHGSKYPLLPALGEYGTFGSSRKVVSIVPASLARASAFAGFHVLAPDVVPPEMGPKRAYRATKVMTESFRFDAALARKSAARTGHPLPEMPAGLDGTTITVTFGPMVVTTWGSARAAIGARGGRSAMAHEEGMAVVQSVAPVVRSSGASLRDLEDYLLKMPGLPPALADQIRAIGDPSTTLPIPIMAAKQTAHPVTVAGAPGLAIGDNTGLGAGVIWQRNGYVYGVFGTLTEDRIMTVATGLH